MQYTALVALTATATMASASSANARTANTGSPARLTEGAILDSDYPPTAMRQGAQGRTTVEFLVAPDGRVTVCGVKQSSGSQDLDLATCDLIRARFVFAPARDPQGRAIQDNQTRSVNWVLPGKLTPLPSPFDYTVTMVVGTDGKVASCNLIGKLDGRINREEVCSEKLFAPPRSLSDSPVVRRVTYHATLAVEDTPR